MLTALNYLVFLYVTEVINEIYDSGEISEDFNLSIFIVLPIEPVENESELNRTINLISYINNQIKIIMNIIRCRSTLLQEPRSFVQENRKRNAF